MSKIALGFLSEPSFLCVAPMIEFHNKNYEIQQILPMTSMPSPHFSSRYPLYTNKGKSKIVFRVADSLKHH